MRLGDVPDDIGINALVLVPQLVSDGDDVAPGHSGILRAITFRYVPDRFRHDLDPRSIAKRRIQSEWKD